MKCPYCSSNNDRVVDSRESKEGLTIRRRRECLSCQRRFTSYEQIEDIPYLVIKSDGTRQEFSRKKLLSGLLKACEKRPVGVKQLDEIVDTAEALLHQAKDREIPTSEIGALLMEKLRSLDPIAFVRFASVYRQFEDVGAFMEEVRALVEEKG